MKIIKVNGLTPIQSGMLFQYMLCLLYTSGINIGLSEIYANPTIRQLGKLIDESGNGNEDMEFGEI